MISSVRSSRASSVSAAGSTGGVSGRIATGAGARSSTITPPRPSAASSVRPGRSGWNRAASHARGSLGGCRGADGGVPAVRRRGAFPWYCCCSAGRWALHRPTQLPEHVGRLHAGVSADRDDGARPHRDPTGRRGDLADRADRHRADAVVQDHDVRPVYGDHARQLGRRRRVAHDAVALAFEDEAQQAFPGGRAFRHHHADRVTHAFSVPRSTCSICRDGAYTMERAVRKAPASCGRTPRDPRSGRRSVRLGGHGHPASDLDGRPPPVRRAGGLRRGVRGRRRRRGAGCEAV